MSYPVSSIQVRNTTRQKLNAWRIPKERRPWKT